MIEFLNRAEGEGGRRRRRRRRKEEGGRRKDHSPVSAAPSPPIPGTGKGEAENEEFIEDLTSSRGKNQGLVLVRSPARQAPTKMVGGWVQFLSFFLCLSLIHGQTWMWCDKPQYCVTSSGLYDDSNITLLKEKKIIVMNSSLSENRLLFKLVNVTDISFSPQKIVFLPSEIGYLRQLVTLGLRSCELMSLPSEVGLLKSLKYLDVSFNLISSLPSEIRYLRELIGFYASGNQLLSVPGSFYELSRISQFSFEQNQIEMIPTEIGKLTSLTAFSFAYNQLTSLPSQIGLLRAVTWVSFRNNMISTIPSEFGLLTLVTNIDFFKNFLIEVPSELGRLRLVTSVNLSQNLLVALPSELGQLQFLTNISVDQNHLEYIPSEFGLLTSMQALVLHSNRLKALPHSLFFGFLSSLILLNMDSNQISTLPKDINTIVSLQFFSMNNNTLKEIPSQLFALTKLLDLQLANNRLTFLPSEIKQLSGLVTLHLENNNLVGITSEIGHLSSLNYLYLYGNQISDLPVQLGMMKSLRLMILAKNQLEALPTEIGRLSWLTVLTVNHNKLVFLPSEIGMLDSLNYLDAQHNFLSHLPSEMGAMSALRYLDLSYNQLKLLPKELESLSLSYLILNNNFLHYISNQMISGVGIQILLLHHNNLSGELIINPPRSALSGVDLSFNRLQTVKIGWQAGFLLKTLRIRGNNLLKEVFFNSAATGLSMTLFDVSENMNDFKIINPPKLHYGANVQINSVNWSLNRLRSFLSQLGRPDVYVESSFVLVSAVFNVEAKKNGITASIQEIYQMVLEFNLLSFDISDNLIYGMMNQSDNPGEVASKLILMNTNISCLGLMKSCFGTTCHPCFDVCGNGYLGPNEECDDWNNKNGDGCSSMCKREDFYFCGPKFSEPDLPYISENPSVCIYQPATKEESQQNITTILLAVLIPLGVILLVFVGIVILVVKKMRQKNQFIKELQRKIGLQNNHIIHPEDLTIVDKQPNLGKGNFGQVRLAMLRETTLVAVKDLINSDEIIDNNNNQITLLEEAKVAAVVPSHPNIVQFLGVCINNESKTFSLVMEYIPNKSLQAFFKSVKDGNQQDLSYKEKLILIKGICAGMDHLSHYSIIHNDLAARNILLEVILLHQQQHQHQQDQHPQQYMLVPKITDFGLSQLLKKRRSSKNNPLPLRWTAPEVILDQKSSSIKSDVWSFGVVVFEVISSCLVVPYCGLTNDQVRKLVVHDQSIMPQSQYLPDEIYSIIKNCCCYDPNKRPSFRTLFRELDGLLKTSSISSIKPEQATIELASNFSDQYNLIYYDRIDDQPQGVYYETDHPQSQTTTCLIYETNLQQ